MRDVLLIMKREFRERVASRSFVIGTILFPLVMVGLLVLPRLVGQGGAQWTLALVNEAPAGVGANFVAALTRPVESRDENTYRIVPVAGTIREVRDDLAGQVQR